MRAVCDWVFAKVHFSPGVCVPTTSAPGALEARVGVCRDFSRLAIARLRALNIPARIASSHDFGADSAFGPTDLHAYVEAFLGDRLYIFDPTHICPHNRLVRIASGLDALDEAGGPATERDDFARVVRTSGMGGSAGQAG